ncbi:hypothetical protein AZ268_gp41 [Acidianus rod-shaped virus 2]|uniref:Uncharacterized protein n=1 Tax=Acidianus rod-shaped virus 2 TaxID=1732175 RepID=A0A0N9P7A0_9VIRU|nr:hypothetical protein AZ268_gp41 [Acidianus rod-shaped virus 2]ALG96909.1 hypothetical protein [Acidianus rod-shaped virus 2]
MVKEGLIEYIKEIGKNKITVYKYGNCKLLEFVEIRLDKGDSKTVYVCFFNDEGWFEYCSKTELKYFGVSSFAELKELPEEDLGEMIWE